MPPRCSLCLCVESSIHSTGSIALRDEVHLVFFAVRDQLNATALGDSLHTLAHAAGDLHQITPIIAHNVKTMSLGYVMDSNAPKIWRGPMIHGAVQQLLRDTEWGELDYLVIDLPPGTGDAQLTIVQSVPLSGVVVVTTPQAVSLLDGAKGIGMFQKLHVPMFGLIENMSGFECPHCQTVTNIFSKGGGEAEALRLGIAFLGAIPIDPQIVTGGDSGRPVVVSHPFSATGKLLFKISERIAANISIIQFEIPLEAR